MDKPSHCQSIDEPALTCIASWIDETSLHQINLPLPAELDLPVSSSPGYRNGKPEHLMTASMSKDGPGHGCFMLFEDSPGTKPTEEDWDRIRQPFTHAYEVEGRSLKEVIILMEQIPFHAPIHAYKKHISGWGLSHNLTSEQKMQFGLLAVNLIAHGQPLPLHDSTGRSIPWNKIRRQVGRNLIPLSKIPRQSPRFRFPKRHSADTASKNNPEYGQSGHQYPCNPLQIIRDQQMLHQKLDLGSTKTAEYILYHINQSFMGWITDETEHGFPFFDTVYTYTRREYSIDPYVPSSMDSDYHLQVLYCLKKAIAAMEQNLIDTATYYLDVAHLCTTKVLRHSTVATYMLLIRVISLSSLRKVPDHYRTVFGLLGFAVRERLQDTHPINVMLKTLARIYGDESSMMLRGTILADFVLERVRAIETTSRKRQADVAFRFYGLTMDFFRGDLEPYLEVQYCKEQIEFLITKFGEHEYVVYYERFRLGLLYQKMNRMEEAYRVWGELWRSWQQEDIAGLSDDWRKHLFCPAEELSGLYGLHRHLIRSRYYLQASIELKLRRWGEQDESVSESVLRWLDTSLQRNDVEQIRAIRQKCPVTYAKWSPRPPGQITKLDD